MSEADAEPQIAPATGTADIELGHPAAAPFDDIDNADHPDPEYADPAAAARHARRRRILLTCALVVVLAAGAAFGIWWWQISRQKEATLSAPLQVAGLYRNDTAEAKSTADYLRTAMAAEVDLDHTLGAVYDDPAGHDRSVLLFGGTALIWTPESDLDTSFGLLKDDTGAVTGIHKVPAGRYGGVMKCGDATSPDGRLAVCGWADHGSIALAMFPNRPVNDSAALMLRLRDGVQTRR